VECKQLRIRRVRKLDRSWIAVLASGVGLYALLSVGFHWFVEPAIITGRSNLPTETLMAYRHASKEEPATSGHLPRGASQISIKPIEPPSPTDGLATTKADQADTKAAVVEAPDVKAPKKEPPRRRATRQANERLVQRSVERRSASWGFSSSPASPNYR
jgi:hypothetical protein